MLRQLRPLALAGTAPEISRSQTHLSLRRPQGKGIPEAAESNYISACFTTNNILLMTILLVSGAHRLKPVGKDKGEIERLAGVEPRVAMGVVARVKVRF